jgi:hypothetical protein
MTHTGFMLDTTVFNHVKRFPNAVFRGRKVFATHVQHDELGRAPDPIKKTHLLKTFTEIGPASLPTQTAVWGDTKWGKARWSSKDGLYNKLLHRICVMDDKTIPMKQSSDARIAEAAIKAGLTLVTDDGNLSQATSEHGGKVMTLEQFVALPASDPAEGG